MDVDFSGLQERLRRHLLAQIQAGQLTGLELARETGFQQAHISNFLNRKRGLSLEAMDAILRARDWTIGDLLPEPNARGAERRSLKASADGVAYIPVVTARNWLANRVPYATAKNALTVVASRLEERAPARSNFGDWPRFVALRVEAEDAWAMGGRFARGSIAVIDRGQRPPGGKRAVFAVGTGKKIVLRYIEQVGRRWMLRAESVESPLMMLADRAAVVGRVCLVMTEM